MSVRSMTMSLIIEPLALVDITISMYQSAITIGHVLFPVTLIDGSILPYLLTFAISKPVLTPLPLIDSRVVNFKWTLGV